MELKPDVEALFEFVGRREESYFEGYRPAHLVKENYLTTGIHSYYNIRKNADGKVRGTITFISPDEYPECLWVGKKLKMYEGRSIVGYATITKIFNTVLQKPDK